jgi:hypothetical protein
MKRLLLICIISLLFVSGWSHVLAAALCPDMQDMPNCHMQTGNAPASSSSHEGHQEMGDTQMRESVEVIEVNALEQPMASCCTGLPTLPPSSFMVSKGAEQPKKELGAVLQKALKVIELPTPLFTPLVLSRQHAPPGVSTQRHVLISVFLI